MQKPRDKGDYGVTPTDDEKSRLTGKEEKGPVALNDDKKQNGTDEEPQSEETPNEADDDDPMRRVMTLYQEGGVG